MQGGGLFLRVTLRVLKVYSVQLFAQAADARCPTCDALLDPWSLLAAMRDCPAGLLFAVQRTLSLPLDAVQVQICCRRRDQMRASLSCVV